MIAYFYCLCKSKDRIKAGELKRSGVEIRLTKHNREYRDQAKQYGLELPILVDDGVARQVWT